MGRVVSGDFTRYFSKYRTRLWTPTRDPGVARRAVLRMAGGARSPLHKAQVGVPPSWQSERGGCGGEGRQCGGASQDRGAQRARRRDGARRKPYHRFMAHTDPLLDLRGGCHTEPLRWQGWVSLSLSLSDLKKYIYCGVREGGEGGVGRRDFFTRPILEVFMSLLTPSPPFSL